MKKTVGYNDWLDMDVLEAYLDGKVDYKTRHQVERASLDDPFVAEALAGLTAAKKRKQSLSILQKQLQERVAQKPVEIKRWRLTSQRLSIGAAAAVLFVVASVFFLMRERYRRSLADQSKTVQVQIAPKSDNGNTTDDSIKPIAKDQSILAAPSRVEEAIEKGTSIATLKSKPIQTVPSGSSMEQPSNALQEVVVPKTSETERIILRKSTTEQPQNNITTLSGKADGISLPNKTSANTANNSILPPELQRVAAQQQQQAAVKIEVEKAPKDNLAKENLGTSGASYAALKQNAADTLAKNVSPMAAVYAATQPVVGWDAYKAKLYEYIYKNAKHSVSGIPTVKLSFTVKPNGDVTKIKVLKSGGKYYDEIAIKALKQNGKWTYASSSKNEGTLDVVFTF